MKFLACISNGAAGGTDTIVGEIIAPSLSAAKDAYAKSVAAHDLPAGLTLIESGTHEALKQARAASLKSVPPKRAGAR